MVKKILQVPYLVWIVVLTIQKNRRGDLAGNTSFQPTASEYQSDGHLSISMQYECTSQQIRNYSLEALVHHGVIEMFLHPVLHRVGRCWSWNNIHQASISIDLCPWLMVDARYGKFITCAALIGPWSSVGIYYHHHDDLMLMSVCVARASQAQLRKGAWRLICTIPGSSAYLYECSYML